MGPRGSCGLTPGPTRSPTPGSCWPRSRNGNGGDNSTKRRKPSCRLLWTPLQQSCRPSSPAERPHCSGSLIAADLVVSGPAVKGERSESVGPWPLTAGPETTPSRVGEPEPPDHQEHVTNGGRGHGG